MNFFKSYHSINSGFASGKPGKLDLSTMNIKTKKQQPTAPQSEMHLNFT